MEANNVIGPISAAHWYCMRQCRESINYLKKQRDPRNEIEINAEKDLLDKFMSDVFEGKAA